jgi:hypothetical protein
MKFQAAADPSGEKVVLRGKVWPRDEKEPASWTVEVVDETPNFYGSPGLYGDATLAEIYIDNIEVTPNQTPDTGSTAANAPSAGKSVAAQSTARPAAAKANGAK